MPAPLHLYLRGKTVLLTGATGFLGKVTLERLLRCAPDVERVYLLIRTRQDQPPASALLRFEREVLPSEVFSTLAHQHGAAWRAWARRKLVPVAGDVSQPRLGLRDHDHADLTSQVDIIINGAASVVFDAPLDAALRHNTHSVGHVAAFARDCRQAALVHISTAYVAGRRVGRFLERPLASDAVAASELADIDRVLASIDDDALAGRWDARTRRARLVEEGTLRAARLGWHDTYTFTKALGEITLERERGDVPTAVIRPTIIESSFRDPSPGWLENLNVGDPLWVEYGRGRMRDFPLLLDTVFDMVPVDFVANAVLAALPRVDEHAEVSYFTVGSGSQNPLTGAQLYDATVAHFTRWPMRDRRGQPIPAPMVNFHTYECFRDIYVEQARRSASAKRLLYLADIYQAYTTSSCVFDTANTARLRDERHEADWDTLDFDVRRIDWPTYIADVHIPGLRRHVIGEGRPSASAASGHV